MLQIATGKLFSRDAIRENLLRGVLYTNAHFEREVVVTTAAGKLSPSSSYSIHPYALVYEFIERIEGDESGRNAIISHTADPYIQDFSTVVSFALGCVCTPDIELARRLTNGTRGLAAREAPRTLVPRFFDKEYWCKADDIAFLQRFIDRLLGLERDTFLRVMGALRTYIVGMHRMADDLELAYMLLVASVESLAQNFHDHEKGWSSVDAIKRNAIDEALTDADETTASRVRTTIADLEHGQLTRRFRAFVMAHTAPAYFREANNIPFKLGRSDMADALDAAYRLRSAYVHDVQELPDEVVMGLSHAETVEVGRSRHLTLHGLSRLMRHAIIEFVFKQATVAKQPYDYHLQLSNVVQLRLSPEYWVGAVGNGFEEAGRAKLEGFLHQMEAFDLQISGAAFTDLRDVLAKSTAAALTTKKVLRLPYFCTSRALQPKGH